MAVRKILGVPILLWLFPPLALAVLVGNLLNQNNNSEDEGEHSLDEKQKEEE
jgi:cytochrome c-type biogenesis protein CcmH/NrfF